MLSVAMFYTTLFYQVNVKKFRISRLTATRPYNKKIAIFYVVQR